VGALKTETGFEEGDELVGVALELVELDERRELLGVDDEVETANLSEAELLLVDAGGVDLLPDPVEERES
jgi:hypothetical protein